MSVFRRPGTTIYSYDFRYGTQRYSGNTGASDKADAIEFESAVRAAVAGSSPLTRTVLKKAKRKLPRNKTQTGYVYVVQSGYFVKIGHSLDPWQRLDTIATASPEACELIFCLAGSALLERRLHREFAASHFRGEWFFFCGRLRRFIEDFKQSVPYDPLQPLPLVAHTPLRKLPVNP